MSSGTMLFACSKCFSRHPFEELSPGQQLCKDCRGSFPVVKCTFCRSEFQQTSKGSTSTICKKCEQNVKLYRKPTACEYCNIIAAFIGNKCQRCTNSEKRYGPPVTCEQCKQKCAFDRKDEDKKVDGKLLCWLCTLSYKRALAKTKQSAQDRREHARLAAQRERAAKHREQSSRPRSHNKRPNRADVTKQPPPQSDGKDSLDISSLATKAPRPVAARSEHDPNSSDHVVAMTQLREKIVSLNKQLSIKDAQLLSKDKMITELKAKHFTIENELRNRMGQSERDFKNKSEIMAAKIKNLQKENATLSKMKVTPKAEKRRHIEIKENERIRTVDPKEYLKKKAKRDDDDKVKDDDDDEDKVVKKSKNRIDDDDDDDSKDIEMADLSARIKVEAEDSSQEKESSQDASIRNGGSIDIKTEEFEKTEVKEDVEEEDKESIKQEETKESEKGSEKESEKDSEKESEKGSEKGSDKEESDKESEKDEDSDRESEKEEKAEADSDSEKYDKGDSERRDTDSTSRAAASDKGSERDEPYSDKNDKDDGSDSDKSDSESVKGSDKGSDKGSPKKSESDSDKESDKGRDKSGKGGDESDADSDSDKEEKESESDSDSDGQ